MAVQFEAEVLPTGKTTTGIVVAPDLVEALGGGRRPKVTATINGHSWRTSIAFMGGEFWLGISAENRAGSGVAAGDRVTVGLAPDTAPRVVEVPEDFAAALAANPKAKAAWDRLSYSHQRRHVLAIEEAKTAETRARRIAKSVSGLSS